MLLIQIQKTLSLLNYNIYSMRKNICLLILFISNLIANPILAQQTEQTLYKITYTFIHRYDTNLSIDPYTTKAQLKIGKTNAQFSNNILQTQKPNNSSNNSSNNSNLITVVGKPTTIVKSKEIDQTIIYQLPLANKLIQIKHIGFQDYLIETTIPTINWRIEETTKIIGGYNCQKAIGAFRGRNYIVWFTAELPFEYGPWKLGGLPGVILEAVDDTNSVSFLFNKIEEVKDYEYIMNVAYRPVKIKEETYLKAKQKFDKDPIAASQAQIKSGTTIESIVFIDNKGNKKYGNDAIAAIKLDAKKKILNPIELNLKSE